MYVPFENCEEVNLFEHFVSFKVICFLIYEVLFYHTKGKYNQQWISKLDEQFVCNTTLPTMLGSKG